MKQKNIPIGKIHLDENQPRDIYDGIEELASSMKEVGFKENFSISVRPHPEITGEFKVIFGHRRTKAATLAGLTEIPCFVFDATLTDAEAYEIQLVENENRKDLTVMNRVRAIQRGIKEYNMPVEKIAKYYGVSESTIKAELELANLTPELNQFVDKGELPKEVARKLATSFAEHEKQMSVFNNHVKGKKNAAAMLAAITTYMEKSAKVDIFAQAKKEAAAGEDGGSLRKFEKAFEKLARSIGEYDKGGYLGNLNVINANKRSLAQVQATAKLLKKAGETILKDLEAYNARQEINAPQKAVANG
jgi:ParB/RepB/Spo0J family partition protein